MAAALIYTIRNVGPSKVHQIMISKERSDRMSLRVDEVNIVLQGTLVGSLVVGGTLVALQWSVRNQLPAQHPHH